MPEYIEGFVTPVKKSKLDEYKKIARKFGRLIMEHGALEYHEFLADDVPYGKKTSFPRSVERKNSETLIFAWVTYKSKAHCKQVQKKLMADEKFMTMMGAGDGEIFDASRMLYGGFTQLVKL